MKAVPEGDGAPDAGGGPGLRRRRLVHRPPRRLGPRRADAVEAIVARAPTARGRAAAPARAVNPVPSTQTVPHERASPLRRPLCVLPWQRREGPHVDGAGPLPEGAGHDVPGDAEPLRREIFATIENGMRLTGMPAWGAPGPDDDAETWELVHPHPAAAPADYGPDRADGGAEPEEPRRVRGRGAHPEVPGRRGRGGVAGRETTHADRGGVHAHEDHGRLDRGVRLPSPASSGPTRGTITR